MALWSGSHSASPPFLFQGISYAELLQQTIYPVPAQAFEEKLITARFQNCQFHCEDGPAAVFEDGSEIYYLKGVRVPKELVLDPGYNTPQRICEEPNSEIASVMLERYGFEKFILDSNATEVDRYLDAAGLPVVLYALGTAALGRISFLTMFNSTVEWDGTRKHYILRVPPTREAAIRCVPAWSALRIMPDAFGVPTMVQDERNDLTPGRQVAERYDPSSALSAMAWTWGLTAEEYTPSLES